MNSSSEPRPKGRALAGHFQMLKAKQIGGEKQCEPSSSPARTGPPVGKVETPEPGTGEIRVRVKAASLNLAA
jgi:hypothetical protein